MTAKTGKSGRQPKIVPATAMEDVPALGEQERSELLASLREAEAQIKAGMGAEYDPEAFKDRLLRLATSSI